MTYVIMVEFIKGMLYSCDCGYKTTIYKMYFQKKKKIKM
jgi:hypothetical protein